MGFSAQIHGCSHPWETGAARVRRKVFAWIWLARVDGLLADAGAQQIFELHGNLRRWRCDSCGNREGPWLSQRCPRCGAQARPDVVMFGEMLDEELLTRTQEVAAQSDVFLVVGTSAAVYPAADLPTIAASNGAKISPLKRMCLSRCRTPLGFLLGEWRPGVQGAFVMGARHALFCIGCCWALMALLFVGGVMNLAWVAALSIAVSLEKLLPRGERLAAALGMVLIALGGIKLLTAWT